MYQDFANAADYIARARALKAQFYAPRPRVAAEQKVEQRAERLKVPIRAVEVPGKVYGPWPFDETFSEFLARRLDDFTAMTPRSVLIAVARRRNVPLDDILGPSHFAVHVAARYEAAATLYVAFPRLSLPQIGRIINRHHSIVLRAVKQLGVWRGGAMAEPELVIVVKNEGEP